MHPRQQETGLAAADGCHIIWLQHASDGRCCIGAARLSARLARVSLSRLIRIVSK